MADNLFVRECVHGHLIIVHGQRVRAVRAAVHSVRI